MKKLILYSLSAILALAVSCQKSPVGNSKGEGALYLGSMELSLDEELDTKASEVSGDYTVSVLNSEGQVVSRKTYAEIKQHDHLFLLHFLLAIVLMSEFCQRPVYR